MPLNEGQNELRINIIIDPQGGWFDKFGDSLEEKLVCAGHQITRVNDQINVKSGDIAFYLSCTGITPPHILSRNTLNIVIHASSLPKGRGFSPMVWQILAGKSTIPLTMIEMTDEVDAGRILMQRTISFSGHELNSEMRNSMGSEIVAMCTDLASLENTPIGKPQSGTPSWYRRRSAEDSRLDPNISLADQFDLLRVVDNDRYPAFFDLRGHRYTLRIDKEVKSSISEPNAGEVKKDA